MISDVLFEAVEDIQSYLAHPSLRGHYKGEIREEILDVVDRMHKLRVKLDAVPEEAALHAGPLRPDEL